MRVPIFSFLCLSIPLLAAGSAIIDQGKDGFVVGRSSGVGIWNNRPYQVVYYADVRQARGPHKKMECLKDSINAFFCDLQQQQGCNTLTPEQWEAVRVDRAKDTEEREEAKQESMIIVDHSDARSAGESSTKAEEVNQQFRLGERQDEQTDQHPRHPHAAKRNPPQNKPPPRSPFYMDATLVAKGLAGKGRGGISFSLVVDAALYLDGHYVPLWNETLRKTNKHWDGLLHETVLQLSANHSQPYHHPFDDPKMDILDIIRQAHKCMDHLGQDIWDFDLDQPILENTTLLGRAASGVWKPGDQQSLEYTILSFIEVFAISGFNPEQESCFYNGIDSFFANPQGFSNGTTFLTPDQAKVARRIAFREEELWATNRSVAEKDLFWSKSIGDANPSTSVDGTPVGLNLQHGVVVWVDGSRITSLEGATEGLEGFLTPILDSLVLQPVEMLAPNDPFRRPEHQDQESTFLPMGMLRLVKECHQTSVPP